jgi:protein-L-isoaspartate(D-aspartate) O-methyltransferase
MDTKTTDVQRREMVRQQVERRGVDDDAVLEALRTVPREAFVPEGYKDMAYGDSPLPIGEGQTISQPYIVALMAELAELGPEDRVLEIGAGSGYGAAVLGQIAGQVYSVERISELADRAREAIDSLGYDNVEIVEGDGTLGLPDKAPFDAIIVTASGPDIPETYRQQLAVGGTIVMPTGARDGGQRLMVCTRTDEDAWETHDEGFVRFVPLIGEEAWSEGGKTGASSPGSDEPSW